jgi:hypothetical protein
VTSTVWPISVKKHGVAIGLEADEVVLGDPPRLARLKAERRLAGGGNQVGALSGKPVRGPLVGRAVHPHVGDLGLPLAELLAQILLVDEGPPGRKLRSKYFTLDRHRCRPNLL